MRKSGWRKKITAASEAAGTYRPYFDQSIEILADIMEKRDQAAATYKELGSQPVIEFTNKGGATNLVKNPALVLWKELNQEALAYWRDLGLTPAGLKKISEEQLKPKQKSALADILSELNAG